MKNKLHQITEALLNVLKTLEYSGHKQIISDKFRINSQPGTYLKILKALRIQNSMNYQNIV